MYTHAALLTALFYGVPPGVLAAAIFAGMFVGGIFFGVLSDQIGRRRSLLYSLLINALFALLSSISPNIYALILFRTCAGIGASQALSLTTSWGLFYNVGMTLNYPPPLAMCVLGIGGTVPAMFTLCTEHVPVHRRGFYVTIVASYWMVGSIFTAGLAWLMLGDPNSPYSWRLFAAVVSIPAFVCWYLTYRFVPESAQYFARRRQFSDAEEVVNHIHFMNGSTVNTAANEATGLLSPFETNSGFYPDIVEKSYAGNSTNSSTKSVEQNEMDKTLLESYRSLFDPILRVTTLSLLMSWFCLSFGSYGLATWITVLFKRIGLADPFANAFIYAAANLPGNLLR